MGDDSWDTNDVDDFQDIDDDRGGGQRDDDDRGGSCPVCGAWIDPANDIPAHIRSAHPDWKPTRGGWCPVCLAKIEFHDDDARELQVHIHENHPEWERWSNGGT